MSRMPRCWFFLFHTKQVFSANKLTHTRWRRRRPNTLTHTHTERTSHATPQIMPRFFTHSLTQTESRHNSWQQHQFYFEKSVTRVQNNNDPPNGRVSRAQQSSKNAFLLRVQVLVAQEMNQQRYTPATTMTRWREETKNGLSFGEKGWIWCVRAPTQAIWKREEKWNHSYRRCCTMQVCFILVRIYSKWARRTKIACAFAIAACRRTNHIIKTIHTAVWFACINYRPASCNS